MKTLALTLVLAVAALPLAACNDVHHTETTKTNWDGSVTHTDTKVITHTDGSTSVDQTKTRTR
jgi:hypothetical protein